MPDETDETPAKTVTSFGSGGSGRYTPGRIAGPTDAGGSPDDTPDDMLTAIVAEAYAAGRRDALAEAEFPQAFRIGDFVQVRQDGSAPREWCYDWARVRLRVVGTIIDEHVPGHVAYFVQAEGDSRREHDPMAEHWLEAADAG